MKRNKSISILSFLLMAVFTILLISACAKKNVPVPSPNVTTKKSYKIGLSMNTLNNPFFVDARNGAQKGAKDNNVTLTVTDAQNSSARQVSDVENLIAQKLDAIIIDPADSDAIVAAIESCNKAKIPVFTMDREANGGTVVAHVGFDAIKAGTIAGDYIASQMKGKANAKIVEIQGIMGTNVAQNRSKGFNDVMTKNNLKVIARQAADFDRAKAMSVMENILSANPVIDAVYAANDEMALGALEAIKASGRKGLVLIGSDAIDQALEKVKSGDMNATIAEPPFFLGKTTLQTAVDHLNGKTVEKKVIMTSTLVTKENASTIKTKE